MNLARFSPLTLAEKLTGRPMAAATRHFFKDSLFYSIANVLPRAMGYFIWPLIAMLVTTDGYAIFSNYNTSISALCILLSAQVELAVARYYYEGKDDFPDFLGTQILFTAGLAAVMTLQFYFFRAFWGRLLVMPGFVLMLAVVTSLAQLSHQVYLQLLLARKRSLSYLNYQLAKQILYVVLVIVLLVFFFEFHLFRSERYLALVLANLLATVPLGLLFLFFLLRMMRPVFRLDHLAYALRLTLPGIAGALALVALNYFDRVFISHYSLDLAGQYAFAYQLGIMISMVTGGIWSAYMPRFYENRKLERYDEIQTMFSRNLKILLLGATALILMSGPVAMIIGSRNKNYLGSLPVIPIIVNGYIFMWLGQCYGLYMTYRRKYLLTQSITLVIASLLNIGLNVWLLPLFHYNTKIAALNTMLPLIAQWLMVAFIARVMLKERTIHFRGALIPCAAYLVFTTLWCLYGY